MVGSEISETAYLRKKYFSCVCHTITDTRSGVYQPRMWKELRYSLGIACMSNMTALLSDTVGVSVVMMRIMMMMMMMPTMCISLCSYGRPIVVRCMGFVWVGLLGWAVGP